MSTTTVCLVLLPVLVIPCLRPEKKSCFWGGNCTGIAVADSSIIAHLGLHPVAYSGCRQTFRSLPPDVQVLAEELGTMYDSMFKVLVHGLSLVPSLGVPQWAGPHSSGMSHTAGVVQAGHPSLGVPQLAGPHSLGMSHTAGVVQAGHPSHPLGCPSKMRGQPTYFVGCSWDVPLQWWDSPPIFMVKDGMSHEVTWGIPLYFTLNSALWFKFSHICKT
ncbi:hypothetical protein C8R47DRAFT_1073089 [Mycena vitilis]|nr:hypothetical protein C8R47DRAFT_1073089 [Mycena vitilis]